MKPSNRIARISYSILLCMLWCHGAKAQQMETVLHAKPVVLSGSFDATAIVYRADGIPQRYLPFNYVITGAPVLSVYGWQIPFAFIIGRQQSRFTQPFNQFGLSPSYKWITIHAGYRSLFFSPFTLAGHTFLGGAIELNPGRFRFAALYGEFNKAAAGDTAQGLYFSNFAYRRMGMAVKLGYGTEDNVIELTALRARDDPNSLRLSKQAADTLGLTPAQDMVVGYHMRIALLKKHLFFESDGAISFYTNDINAPQVQDSSFDKEVQKVAGVATVTTSSELYGAIQASVRYKARDFGLRLQYQHIDPGYQSMGAYFLNNDLENITIAPSVAAFKHRLRLSGSLGFQHDDLAGNKRARSKKWIGSANIAADFTERLSLDGNFSNYTVTPTLKTVRFADSLKVVETSRQFYLAPRYLISGLVSHAIMLSATVSEARELNPVRRDSIGGNIDTYNYLLNYQLGFTEQYASIYVSLNHTQMKGDMIIDRNMGATVGGSKAWYKGRFNISLSAGYLLARRNDIDGRIITGSFQARYAFFGRHALHFTGWYTGNRPSMPSVLYPSYSEVRAEAGYGFSF